MSIVRDKIIMDRGELVTVRTSFGSRKGVPRAYTLPSEVWKNRRARKYNLNEGTCSSVLDVLSASGFIISRR